MNIKFKPFRVIDEEAGAFGIIFWECRHGHPHLFKLGAWLCGCRGAA